jgi:NAD(P)-dependent dehydrogenase (short-subunit alcohol dehydrogenase family)
MDSAAVRLMDEQLEIFHWCAAAGAAMQENGGGSIVCFSSVLAMRGVAQAGLQSMVHGGIAALVRSLAVEWARNGVRVNGIGLGWYETSRRPVEEQRQEQLVRYLPARRKGHPDDVMELLIYLASGESEYVTGQTIYVDGGALAHA